MNRPPTPDVRDEQEKEPTLQEIMSIKVRLFSHKYNIQFEVREGLIFSSLRCLALRSEYIFYIGVFGYSIIKHLLGLS